MKNKLYYLGVFACILLLIGCIFKVSHWPAANIFLIIAILFLTLIFLPLAIVNCLKVKSEQKFESLYVIAYLVVTFGFISALFKILHWPGSSILLAISIPLPFVLFLPVYLIVNRKDKEINYRNFIAIMFFAAYFAADSALLSLSPSKTLLEEYLISANQLEVKNQVYEKQLSNMAKKIAASADSFVASNKMNLQNLMDNSSQIHQLIDELKVKLVTSVNSDNSLFIGEDKRLTLAKMKGMDLVPSPKTSEADQKKLKILLESFQVNLGKSLPAGSNIEDHLTNLEDTEKAEWEQSVIQGRQLIEALSTLDLIKCQISTSEITVLSRFL